MNSSYITEEPLRGIISIEFASEELQEAVDKKIKNISHTIDLPGFRKGKVPKGIIEKRFGEAIRYETASEKAQDEMQRLYIENNLNSITAPIREELALGEEGKYEFKYIFPLTPQMKVSIDKDIEVPFYNVEPTDEDVDNASKQILDANGEEVNVEKSEAPGDMFTGKLVELDTEGNPLENGIVKEHAFLAPKYFRNEEQKKAFDGVAVGNVIRFNPYIAFDKMGAILKNTLGIESNEEALEHQGDFEFTVETIRHYEPAKLGEHFYKKYFGEDTGIKDEEAYRKELRARIKKELDNEAKHFFRQHLIELLLEKVGNPEFDRETVKRVIEVNASQDRKDKAPLTDAELDNEVKRFADFLYYRELISGLVDEYKLEISEEKVEEKIEAQIIGEIQRMGYPVNGMEPIIEQLVQQRKEDKDRLYQARNAVAEDEIGAFAFDLVTRKEETITPDEFQKKIDEFQKKQMDKVGVNNVLDEEEDAQSEASENAEA